MAETTPRAAGAPYGSGVPCDDAGRGDEEDYGGDPPSEVAESSAPIGMTRFGVFPRYRSVTGGDVFPRGYPTRGARPVEHVPLADALSRRWDDDRHVVLYTASMPYRINNAALPKVRVEMRLLAFDVDNHDDALGWLEAERPKIAALLSVHSGGFAYTTRRGWRVLFALAPLPIRSEADKEAFALYYARVAAYVFGRFGIVLDAALTRWNQPIRLPHVVRGGEVFDAEILGGNPSALGVFELPKDIPSRPDLRSLSAVLPSWGGVAKRWQPPQRATFRVTSSATFDHIPLAPYAERIAAAAGWAREEAPRAILHHGGRATARAVAAMLHVGFALEREDVARILTGPYNRRCSPPWSEAEMDDLRGIAQAVARTPIQAWGFMVGRDRTGLEAARTTLAAAAESRHVVALEEVSARVVGAIEQHRAVVLRATYGAGKTYAVSRYIATRTSGRVVVVVPRHELGRAWVTALAAAGEHDVAYHASVVQRRDEATGRRHCDNKLALRVYRHGGDVARDVCPSCPRAATCPAYAARPNAGARVHIVPREMIPKLEITGEDLVVFDDAAVDLLAWHRLGGQQLRRIAGADARLTPALQARLLSIFVAALLAPPRRMEESVRSGLAAAGLVVPERDALRALATWLVEGQRSPRLPRDLLAEEGGDLTETLRDVDRIRQVLRFAGACAEGGRVHWSEDVRSVHGETPAAALVRSHPGRLVILDAAANVEELLALRSDLHVERLDVDDAGEVERVLLFSKHATRTALQDPRARRALLDAWLGAVFTRLSARPVRRPVLVVYKEFEAEVRDHPAVRAWCAARPGREVRVAHYGALRGSNRFQRCDAVVTLGDPWLNGNDVTGRAAWLGLDEPSYRIALATAELGQAHGRSRSVRRRRRLTHVHVGRLVPDGWAEGVVLEPLGGPPTRTREPAERVEFSALVARLGGNRAAAIRLGCSSSAVAGWKGGARGLPQEALLRARLLVAEQVKDSVSSDEPGAAAAAVEMDAAAYRDLISGCVHRGEGSSAVGEEGSHGEPADETVRPARVAGPVVSEGADSDPSKIQIPLRGEVPAGPLRRGVLVALRGGQEESDERGGAPHGARDERIAPGGAEGRRNRFYAERTLAMLDAMEGGEPRAPVVRAETPSFDEELALLAEAQAHARRRLGFGS